MDSKVRYSSFENKFEIIYRNEEPTVVMPPHTHNAIEIYLNMTKLPNIVLGSNVMPLEPNTLLIIPSYCVHQFTQQLNKKYERYIITISTSWMESIISGNERYKYLTDTKNPIIIQTDETQRTRLISRINEFLKCERNDTFSELTLFFDILKIVDEFSRVLVPEFPNLEYTHITGARKTVKDIIEYIDAHLTENIKLNDIAKHFYLTPNHISRIFKQYTNSQISNYITLQRMTMAKQMFRKGYSVTEVQQATGYSSYEHFFRTFKKNVGVTPREYLDTYYNNFVRLSIDFHSKMPPF